MKETNSEVKNSKTHFTLGAPNLFVDRTDSENGGAFYITVSLKISLFVNAKYSHKREVRYGSPFILVQKIIALKRFNGKLRIALEFTHLRKNKLSKEYAKLNGL